MGQQTVIFAEDPGAVNCVAPLVHALVERGADVVQLAAGHAVPLLRARGLNPEQFSPLDAAGIAKMMGDARQLVVGTSENPDSPAFVLIAAARRAGVPSVGIVDAAMNAAHRFRGVSDHALTHAPDWLLVPDEWTAEQFTGLGFTDDRLVVVGHPHYDHVAKEKERLDRLGRAAVRQRVFSTAARDKFVVVFVSEISAGLDERQYRKSETYTLQGRGRTSGRTEIVIEEVLEAFAKLSAEGLPPPFLVLRRHPKEAPEDFTEYVPHFDAVSIGGGALEVLYAADLVIGMSSMALAEAQSLDVRTLSVLPRECERDWLAGTREGRIECVTRSDDLIAALRRLLSGPVAAPGKMRIHTSQPSTSSLDRMLAFLDANGLDRQEVGR